MAIRSSKLVTIGLVAMAMIGTATSAFADRNQYTRHRMGMDRPHMGYMHHMRPMSHHRMRMHRMHRMERMRMMHRRHMM